MVLLLQNIQDDFRWWRFLDIVRAFLVFFLNVFLFRPTIVAITPVFTSILTMQLGMNA